MRFRIWHPSPIGDMGSSFTGMSGLVPDGSEQKIGVLFLGVPTTRIIGFGVRLGFGFQGLGFMTLNPKP